MMKQRLLTLAAAILSLSATAQTYAPDYSFNIGVYGGLAPISKIYRLRDYTPDEKSLPSQFGVIFHYNVLSRLQLGLDVNTSSEWTSKGSYTLNGTNGNTLGQVPIRYVYADRVWTTIFRINGLIPMYDRLKNNRANFYYGIAGGAIFTVNDAATLYSQFNDLRGPDYTYISEYHYEPGAGYIVGAQLGMEWYTPGRLGINIEAAPRFAHVNTVDSRQANRNGPYDLFMFPFSFGIRYRFGSSGQYNW